MKYLLALSMAFVSLQDKDKDKDKPQQGLMDDEYGFALSKPKGDEWEVSKLAKEPGGLVTHKTETFTLKLTLETKMDQQKFNPLNTAADKAIEKIGTDKDGKALPNRKLLTRKSEDSKFPGAGGPKAYYADVLVRDEDKEFSVRWWFFVDKTNPNNMFQFEITGSDELHRRFQKEVAAILQSFRTFKVKKR